MKNVHLIKFYLYNTHNNECIMHTANHEVRYELVYKPMQYSSNHIELNVVKGCDVIEYVERSSYGVAVYDSIPKEWLVRILSMS